MCSSNDHHLYEGKYRHQAIPIPDSLGDAIQQGMTKAKQHKKRISWLKRGTLIAATLLVVAISTIRLSPTMAAYIRAC